MKHIQTAVAAYLQQATGVKTVCGRTRVRGEYPLLAVGAGKEGTTLLSGGRLAEHCYKVTVTAVSDREREENTALLSALSVPLLRGIPLETEEGEHRVLHPLNLSVEGETLTFTLELCVPVPPVSGGEQGGETMETLHFQV